MNKEWFKTQTDEGATDNFFFVVKHGGNVNIRRHRGTVEEFPYHLYEFVGMVGKTPELRLKEG